MSAGKTICLGHFTYFVKNKDFQLLKAYSFFLSDVVGFLVRICGLCDSFIFNGEPSSSCRPKFVLAVQENKCTHKAYCT